KAELSAASDRADLDAASLAAVVSGEVEHRPRGERAAAGNETNRGDESSLLSVVGKLLALLGRAGGVVAADVLGVLVFVERFQAEHRTHDQPDGARAHQHDAHIASGAAAAGAGIGHERSILL